MVSELPHLVYGSKKPTRILLYLPLSPRYPPPIVLSHPPISSLLSCLLSPFSCLSSPLSPLPSPLSSPLLPSPPSSSSFDERQAVSLKMMLAHSGQPPLTTYSLIRTGQWMLEELPIRLAVQVKAIDRMPYGLCLMPSVQRVRKWYERERKGRVRERGRKAQREERGEPSIRGTDYRSITSASMAHVTRPRMIYANQWMVEQTWGVKERS